MDKYLKIFNFLIQKWKNKDRIEKLRVCKVDNFNK